MYNKESFVQFAMIGVHASVWIVIVVIKIIQYLNPAGLQLDEIIKSVDNMKIVNIVYAILLVPFCYIIGLLIDQICHFILQGTYKQIKAAALGIPARIEKENFLEEILNKVDDKEQDFLNTYYKINNEKKSYILKSPLAGTVQVKIFNLLKAAGYGFIDPGDEWIALHSELLYNEYRARMTRARILRAMIFNWPCIGLAGLLYVCQYDNWLYYTFFPMTIVLGGLSYVAWRQFIKRAYTFKANTVKALEAKQKQET